MAANNLFAEVAGIEAGRDLYISLGKTDHPQLLRLQVILPGHPKSGEIKTGAMVHLTRS